MSFENIQVNKALVGELFKNDIFYFEQNEKKGKILDEISFIGNNSAQICIIYKNIDKSTINTEGLEMLSKMMQACKMKLENCALILFDELKTKNYQTIISSLNPKLVILFGVQAKEIELPMIFPLYQNQSFAEIVFLQASYISSMVTDMDEKKKLWACLKIFFII